MPEHTSLLLSEGETYWFEDDYLIALDHGYYRYGISRSYTALTEDQYSGNTTITVAGDSETHVNACVQDERTGLMWNKAPSSAVGPATDGRLYWDDHCVQIQHDGANGGWAKNEKVTQAVSGATGIVRQTYETGNRLTLYNVTGTFDTTNTISGDVSGGPDTPSSIRVGAKKDIWSYVRAANMAALGGHRDWRIPNVFEMLSIMNYSTTNGNAHPDSAYFTLISPASNYIYTSTHYGGYQAFIIRPANGSTPWGATGEKAHVSGHTYLVRGPDITESRPCLLPSTGQVVTAESQFADDGFYRKGITREFEALNDGQYKGDNFWVPNAIGIARFFSNNCVLDKLTGLMWTKERTDDLVNWRDISGNRNDVYENLRLANLAKLGGHDDWRIPTIFEAISIIDLNSFVPFSTYFHGGVFWTATPRPDSPTNNVFRYTGGLIGSGASRTTTNTAYIRFVRGGSTDEDL